jgi:tetratricopeptide (TPR) repeat protein
MADPERSLWSETYDRDLHDVLTLHKEVTRDIARQIELSLSASESDRLGIIRGVDPEAYRLYLQGRHLMETPSGEQMEKSIGLFQAGVATDPDFALAYVGLADAYTRLANLGNASRKPMLPKAQAAAEQALELDPLLGEAYASLATIAFNRWDWAEAERYFSRAIALSPGYARARIGHGEFLASQGHFERGLAEMRIAQQLDPLGRETNVETGFILYQSGRFDDALVEFDQVLELHPNYTRANFMRGLAYLALRRYDDALRDFEKCQSCPWTFGVAYGATGRTEDAHEVIASYLERVKTESWLTGFIAVQYVATGEKDQAFEWLERAIDNGDYWPEWLLVGPLFDPLRDDPRFDKLVRRMNFSSTD